MRGTQWRAHWSCVATLLDPGEPGRAGAQLEPLGLLHLREHLPSLAGQSRGEIWSLALPGLPPPLPPAFRFQGLQLPPASQLDLGDRWPLAQEAPGCGSV